MTKGTDPGEGDDGVDGETGEMDGMDEQGGMGEEEPYIGDIDTDGVVSEDQLRPTPEQHQQLKNTLHDGDVFDDLRRADRRYMVIGAGGDEGPGKRRQLVVDRLDERLGATAFRMEDFGFTGDELELWAPAFDILSEMASHIVGVIEDFDGGHVWELGFLYRKQTHVRDILWLLKRIYESDRVMREQYDNGMAASHMHLLEKAAEDRVITWRETDDLLEAVEEIP